MISGQHSRGRPPVGQCRPLDGPSLSAADAWPASAAKAVKGKIAPASRPSEHASHLMDLADFAEIEEIKKRRPC